MLDAAATPSSSAVTAPHPLDLPHQKRCGNGEALALAVVDAGEFAVRLLVPASTRLIELGFAGAAESATTSIGTFQRPQPLADIEVFAERVRDEINPSDWLEVWLNEKQREGRNHRVVSRRPRATPAGSVGDVLVQWQTGSGTFIERSVALKYGSRMFLVACRCSLAFYDELAVDFLWSIASFAPETEGESLLAERVNEVAGSMPFDFELVMPDSWEVMMRPETADGSWFDAFHRAPEPEDEELGERDGRLTMLVMARSCAARPRDAANTLFRGLRDAGVSFDNADFVDDDNAPPPLFSDTRRAPSFLQSWLLVTAVEVATDPTSDTDAKGQNPATAGELRCRVMMHKHAWVIAAVIGPAADHSAPDSLEHASWMRNRRALDVATSSLKMDMRL